MTTPTAKGSSTIRPSHWKAEDGSRIEIDMSGEDYQISTTVFYYSPDYTEQEDDYDVFSDDSI